jgi:hypothetical protein
MNISAETLDATAQTRILRDFTHLGPIILDIRLEGTQHAFNEGHLKQCLRIFPRRPGSSIFCRNV